MSQSPSSGQALELADIAVKAIASGIKKENPDFDRVQRIVGNPGAIYDFFRKLFSEKTEDKKVAPILKFLSGDEKLVIEALDGKKFIYGDKKVFESDIDSDFENYGLKKAGVATPETAVRVYEMVEDAVFAKMFTSLSGDLDKLCLTQHQIKRFCVKYSNWLCRGYSTFFLFKMNGEYFVASVRVSAGGLSAHVNRFKYDDVWLAECRRRVVVPQL
ncbi:MAG: hypothetical protein PHO56_05490 [Patescibacteria group bacterium]|nr:hypothetical protein [Patescibacteria group bacterium]